MKQYKDLKYMEREDHKDILVSGPALTLGELLK